jgi:diguanylate cyclase (GGDEF)-like protein
MSAQNETLSKAAASAEGRGFLAYVHKNGVPAKLKQRAQFRWLLVNLFFNLVAINVDKIALGEHFDQALTIRLFLITPLFLCAIALHLWSSNLTIRSFATGIATVAFIATVTGLAQFADVAFSSRYLMIATFMLFVAILFSGLRWQATKLTAAVSFVLFSILTAINIHLEIVYINIDLIFLCGSTAGLALVLRRRQDLQMSEILAMRKIDAMRVLELNEANAGLARLSNTDPLTGLFNRRYLDEYIDGYSTALTPDSGYGVLMVDIDHFKQLNDSSGHAEGDRCLRRIANVIAQAMRSNADIAVRYGGEEFAILLRDSDVHETLALAERLRRAVEELRFPNPGAGPNRHVTVSIGAHVARPSENVTEALAQADGMLYEAKRSGRNRVISAARARVVATG